MLLAIAYSIISVSIVIWSLFQCAPTLTPWDSPRCQLKNELQTPNCVKTQLALHFQPRLLMLRRRRALNYRRKSRHCSWPVSIGITLSRSSRWLYYRNLVLGCGGFLEDESYQSFRPYQPSHRYLTTPATIPLLLSVRIHRSKREGTSQLRESQSNCFLER